MSEVVLEGLSWPMFSMIYPLLHFVTNKCNINVTNQHKVIAKYLIE